MDLISIIFHLFLFLHLSQFPVVALKTTTKKTGFRDANPLQRLHLDHHLWQQVQVHLPLWQ